jgi:hypothetical protein
MQCTGQNPNRLRGRNVLTFPANGRRHLGNVGQDTNNANFVEAKTSRSYSRPDHKVRVGRWRENPSKEDIDRVLPIVGPIAQSFGYDLTDVRVC